MEDPEEAKGIVLFYYFLDKEEKPMIRNHSLRLLERRNR